CASAGNSQFDYW
nr:immunoglobulin heavy chain junction region [Macaca mulatta]